MFPTTMHLHSFGICSRSLHSAQELDELAALGAQREEEAQPEAAPARIVAVTFPGIVRNPARAIEMLGGIQVRRRTLGVAPRKICSPTTIRTVGGKASVQFGGNRGFGE